jgi:hypothetical protein
LTKAWALLEKLAKACEIPVLSHGWPGDRKGGHAIRVANTHPDGRSADTRTRWITSPVGDILERWRIAAF